MRRLLLIICAILPMVCVAQNRVLKGVVFGANEAPIAGVTISVENSTETTSSANGGQFEIVVSPYAKYLVATAEGYHPARLEIDGSFMVFRLKVDKKYLENKLKAEEDARLAAEKEALVKAKAEEDARLAAEKEAKAKAKAEEDARLAAEKEAKAKVKAEARAEVLANAPTAEEKRMAKEAKRAEYIAAMEAELAEADRVKAEKMAAREAVRKSDGFTSEVVNNRANSAPSKKTTSGGLSSEVINNTTKKNNDLYQSIGFGVQLSADYEEYHNFGLKYIRGREFEKFILGAGVGLSVCYGSHGGTRMINVDEWGDRVLLDPAPAYMPLFVYLKKNANVDDDVCPFVALAAGANVSLPFLVDLNSYEYRCGYRSDISDAAYTPSYFFVNPHVGLNFKTNNNKDMSVSLGVQFVKCPYYDNIDFSIRKNSRSFCMDFLISYIF